MGMQNGTNTVENYLVLFNKVNIIFIIDLGASQGELMVKILPANAGAIRGTGFIPGSGRSPGGRHDNPLQYSCLENLHGQRSLGGYSPWGPKESDKTEPPKHTCTHKSRCPCHLLCVSLIALIFFLFLYLLVIHVVIGIYHVLCQVLGIRTRMR